MNYPIHMIENLHILLGMPCNARCTMCYQKDFSTLIPEAVWKDKLIELYPSLKHIVIQGGEPTILPNTKNFINLVSKINPKTKHSFMTNGILFNDYWIDTFVKNGSYVNFSINAATEDTYATVVKHGNWSKTTRNLKDLVKARNDSKSDLEIRSSFVIFDENYSEIKDFITFCKDIGVDKIRFFFDLSRISTDNREKISKLLDKEELGDGDQDIEIEGLKMLHAALKKQKVDSKYLQSYKCTKPFNWLYINTAGDVSFCCLLGNAGKLGNVLDEPLEEIINTDRANVIRDDHTQKKYTYCSPFYCRG